MNERLNPYRQFMLVLAIMSVFGSIVLSTILSSLIEKNTLEESVEITREGVERHFKGLIPSLFENAPDDRIDSEKHKQIKGIIQMHFDVYDIEETKFIRPNGRIYFSYDPNEIGQILPVDETFSKALNKIDISVKKKDRNHLLIWFPISDESGKVKQVVLVNRDISKQMQNIRHIQMIGLLIIVLTFLMFYFSLRKVFISSTKKIELAFHDPLTGLPNRRLFINQLNLVLNQTKKKDYMTAVMFMDLDRFKNINDTLGHDIGDGLLKAVGLRLKEYIRKDDMIARIGGDEFTLLISQIHDVEEVIKIAQKILDAFKQPFKIEGHEIYTSPSIGIAVWPDDAQDAETLIKCADTAMYCAKERGKNGFQLYSEDINCQMLERLKLENELRKSLKQNDFHLHYQPKLDIRSGKMIGIETLVRWNHPELGMISPTKFIPVAEETGLIVELGEWIMRTACMQNKKWQDAGFSPIPIAVNLSARQFKQSNLVKNIFDILLDTGLDAKWLELEITESTLMNVRDNVSMLNQLRLKGIQISIDDFGTGYSSLSYLKNLPIDTLKIDQSFVHDITFNDDDKPIIQLIISMAKALKLRVIAEGIETEEQMSFLHNQGCYEGQGYLFYKPMPPEEIEKILILHKGPETQMVI